MLNRLLLFFGFVKKHYNWEKVIKSCDGYDSTIILEKVKNATNKVINHEYKYERDGVNFNETDLPWPLFTFLLKLSKEHDNLKVCLLSSFS